MGAFFLALRRRVLLYLLSQAGVIQWQNESFPSFKRGFDSLHPLTEIFRTRAAFPTRAAFSFFRALLALTGPGDRG